MKRELNTREAYINDMMLSVFKEEVQEMERGLPGFETRVF